MKIDSIPHCGNGGPYRMWRNDYLTFVNRRAASKNVQE